MLIRRAADHVRMPWANGLGTTLELVVHPAGASMAAMDWRISIATVAQPGPFSLLPGIDRVLLLLDDVDAVLAVDTRTTTMRRFDQVRFSGDSEVALVAVSGPAHDLNLMTRRGRWSGSMHVVDLADGVTSGDVDATEVWLLVAAGTAIAVEGGTTADLGGLDLVRLDGTTRVSGQGHAVVIEIDEVGPPAG